MKRLSLFLVSVAVFTGCSMEPEPNTWQYKSVHYFDAYKKEFLSAKDLLAQADLDSAVNYAKQGADVKQLASIYLGKCALNIAVGVEDNCLEYQALQSEIASPALQNYYKMVQKDFTGLDPQTVPSKYKKFALAMKSDEIKEANEAVQEIEEPSSQLIAIALLADKVSKETLQKAIEQLSYYGYKKGVLFLLELLQGKTTEPDEKERLCKKIELIQ